MAIIPTDRKEKVDPADSAPVEKQTKPKKEKTDVKLKLKGGDQLVISPQIEPLKEQSGDSMEQVHETVLRIIEMCNRAKRRRLKEELSHTRDWGTSSLVKQLKKETPGEELDEVYLHDPDTYLRMATQAREQGKILRAALLTRIASAVRRKDMATATTLRRSLPATQE